MRTALRSTSLWLVKWGPFEWSEKTEADARARVETVIRDLGAFRQYVTVARARR